MPTTARELGRLALEEVRARLSGAGFPAPPAAPTLPARSERDEPSASVNLLIGAPPSRPGPGSDVCIDDVVLRELAPKAP